MKVKSESEVTQSCPTLCDPMACSLPGSSVHRIFQARVLEWVAISFSRGSSWPRDRSRISHIAGRRFTVWATREANAEAPKSGSQKCGHGCPRTALGKEPPHPRAFRLKLECHMIYSSQEPFPPGWSTSKNLRFTLKSKFPNIFLCPLAITGVVAPR